MASYLVVGRHVVYIEPHLDNILNIDAGYTLGQQGFQDRVIPVQGANGLQAQAFQMIAIYIMPPALAG